MSESASLGPSAFAARLVEAQAAAGIKNEDLAREIGVGLRLVQRWRAGESKPGGENLVALAAALGKHPGWFYEAPDTKAAA